MRLLTESEKLSKKPLSARFIQIAEALCCFSLAVITTIVLKESSLPIWSQNIPPIVLIICLTHIRIKLETNFTLDISIAGIRTMILSILAMMV